MKERQTFHWCISGQTIIGSALNREETLVGGWICFHWSIRNQSCYNPPRKNCSSNQSWYNPPRKNCSQRKHLSHDVDSPRKHLSHDVDGIRICSALRAKQLTPSQQWMAAFNEDATLHVWRLWNACNHLTKPFAMLSKIAWAKWLQAFQLPLLGRKE